MVFVFFWKDKCYDFYCFCGRVILEEGEEGIEEFLWELFIYVFFSYIVRILLVKSEESGDW